MYSAPKRVAESGLLTLYSVLYTLSVRFYVGLVLRDGTVGGGASLAGAAALGDPAGAPQERSPGRGAAGLRSRRALALAVAF